MKSLIYDTLLLVSEEINTFLDPGNPQKPLMLGNISMFNDGDEFTASLKDKLIVSLVNIEEDRIAKTPDHFIKQGDRTIYRNPPLHFNITLIFSATHSYEKALPLIEGVIRFFQVKYVFDATNTTGLDEEVERVVFDLVSLNLEQMHQLWTSLGGKYIPSVIFKMRMMTIDERTDKANAPAIVEIVIDDKQKN
ncbi:MAG: DUF4255 domain-containing protein [Bacteroidota bacterium]